MQKTTIKALIALRVFTLFQQPLALRPELVPTHLIKPGDKQTVIGSIKVAGLLQPILLRPSEDPNFSYEIVDGSRRHHTVSTLGWPAINAIVTQGSRAQIAAASAIANAARSANPVQEALAWKAVMEEGIYADLNALAKDLCVSVALIKKRLKLTELPAALLTDLQAGTLAEGTAEHISRLDPTYKALALQAYAEVKSRGQAFTSDDLSDVRRRKQGDTRAQVLGVLAQVSLVQPLMALPGAQVLAEQVRRMAQDRHIDLADLARELGFVALGSSEAARPGLPTTEVVFTSAEVVLTPAGLASTPAPTEEEWDFSAPLRNRAAETDERDLTTAAQVVPELRTQSAERDWLSTATVN